MKTLKRVSVRERTGWRIGIRVVMRGKRCPKCGKRYPRTLEYWYKSDTKSGLTKCCKFCIIARNKEWQRNNPERYAESKKQANKRRTAEFQEYKEAHPCMDCGNYWPYYVMQFDHRPGEVKFMDVSQMVLRYPAEAVWTEIAKCDLVCANCHFIRTHNRGGPRSRAF